MAFNKCLLKDIYARVYFDITFIQIESQSLQYITDTSQVSCAELQVSLADKHDRAMARTLYITRLIISIKIYNYFPIWLIRRRHGAHRVYRPIEHRADR